MRKYKETETITGRIQSKNISCSLDKRTYKALLEKYKSNTKILRDFYINKLGLKDEWELENWVIDKLNEEINLSKRDNFTSVVEETMTPLIINFIENKLKKESLGFLEKQELKNKISDAQEVLDEKNS